ncbi:uncharacterized protein PG998_003444 [Apiospora kogelbergensis]|uniref:uncharacterized protein n=1 Tax=Apiospora kogelbergensis TaxID=1337665 RepID=UPI003130CFCD
MDHSGNAHSPQNNNPWSRKRTLSLCGFLGKIIPTHRPEQGGTLRSLVNTSTESAYRDLNINPEELKDWNIAQDLPAGKRLGLDDDHTRYSHSSDTPRSSTKSKMTKLTKTVRHAEDEYEKAKRTEDVVGENRMAEKAQATLARIEQTKAEIYQQHGPLAWRQNRREWSSAQEPQLSPIAQSFMNAELDDQPQEPIIEDALPVSYTESKGKGMTRALPASRNRSGKVNKLQKRRRNCLLIKAKKTGIQKQTLKIQTLSERGKPFLWMRRRRATDPGGLDTNEATVTSLLMTEQKDHFNGLIIPDSCLEFPTAQTGEQLPEENNVRSPQRSGSLGMIEDGDQFPQLSSQIDRRSSKDRDQPNAVATVISSQSTLKEHMKNPFAARRKLDRSRSATDLVTNTSQPHQPVRHSGEGGMFRHKTYSQVDVRKVKTSEETPSRSQDAGKQTETLLSDSLATDCDQERSRQGRDTARKADVELDRKKDITPREIHRSDEIPRGVEGERTPELLNEIIETITSSGETHQNKDSVYTPTITTIGCARALLIQTMPGAILGQVDRPTAGLTDAPVTQRLNGKPPRSLGRWTNQAGDGTAPSPSHYNAERLAETRIQPLSSHLRYCVGQDGGDTPSQLVRRQTVSAGPRDFEKEERREQASPNSRIDDKTPCRRHTVKRETSRGHGPRSCTYSNAAVPGRSSKGKPSQGVQQKGEERGGEEENRKQDRGQGEKQRHRRRFVHAP